MTVQEVCRSFGVPAESPLASVLEDAKGPLTANQAVGCLGRSVHVGVARRLVATLVARGTVAKGMTYGSAYSGVDTFAAAVEETARRVAVWRREVPGCSTRGAGTAAKQLVDEGPTKSEGDQQHRERELARARAPVSVSLSVNGSVRVFSVSRAARAHRPEAKSSASTVCRQRRPLPSVA